MTGEFEGFPSAAIRDLRVAVTIDTERLATAPEIIARHATGCAAGLRQLDPVAVETNGEGQR